VTEHKRASTVLGHAIAAGDRRADRGVLADVNRDCVGGSVRACEVEIGAEIASINAVPGSLEVESISNIYRAVDDDRPRCRSAENQGLVCVIRLGQRAHGGRCGGPDV